MDDVKGWLKKVEDVKKGSADLSKDEDLSIAIMNLISLEEHFYFTAMKTENQKYIDMLNSVREMRKNLLRKLVREPKGEEWCISKHLLAASMRLIEVGTKELTNGRKEDAQRLFRHAFDLYSLFFSINLKLIGVEKLKELPESEKSAMQKFSAVIKKIVDCCRE